MRTIGKIIIFLLLPLTALEANAQDDLYMNIIQTDGSVVRVPVNQIKEVKIDKASYNPRPMSINVSGEALEDNAHAAGAMRRIPPTTTNTLDKFYLNYVYDNGNVVVGEPELYTDNVEEGEWLVSTTTYPGTGGWPFLAPNETPVTFYAYANVDVDTEDYDNNMFFLDDDSNQPYIIFGMDQYARSLNDLLVAQATDSWANCGGRLNLSFEHACAALEFYISKTPSLDDYIVDVNNVKIHNVPSVGLYYFNSGNWEAMTDYVEKYTVYALDNDALTVKNDADGKDLLIGEGDYMFVIPQQLTPWDKNGSPLDSNGTYIEITCKISKEGEYVLGGEDEDDWGKAYLPFEANLLKGRIQPFTIKMGTALRDVSGNRIFQ